MIRKATPVALALVVVAGAVRWHAAVALAGALVFLVAIRGVVRRKPARGSRWSRGWWLLPVATVPLVAATLTGLDGRQRLAPGLGGLAAAVVLAGLVRTRPVRDAAQARELFLEAVLTGLLAAYVAGGLLMVGALSLTVALHLGALAVEVAAFAVALQQVRRDRAGATSADRLVLACLGMLVLARGGHLLALVHGTVPHVAQVVVSAATAAALLLLALALAGPQLAERTPVAVATDAVLAGGHVGVVVAVVLAGPAAVTLHGLIRGNDELLQLAGAGAVLALLGVLHLVQLVRDHGRRAWRARHDALTGLPTEPLFHDRLDQAIARALRTGRGLAVAFVDLDGFKRVNDRDGHEAGDAVLRTVAARLRAALRAEDTVARKSGDEFLVLLPDVEGAAAAEVVAEKLVTALREPVTIANATHRVGASVGLALWPRDGHDAEELIRHADAAMYDVKEDHGDAVRWYTRVTTARTRLRLTLATQLESAIDDPDQLEVAFHPRVDLRDGSVEALIALVRWRHPELGLITPRSFLPLAGEAGLSRALDLAVLERTAHQIESWRATQWCDVPVLVHVTDSHAGHPAMEEDVVAILRRTRLPPNRMQLGVSEVGLARGGPRAATSIRELAESGVATILTRFGTGAISLDTLAEVAVAGVELASQHVEAEAARVLGVALVVADRLHLRVTANGVTSPEHIETLRALGCRAARGPALAPPLLAAQLGARLARLAETPSRPLTVAALLGADGGADPERPEVAAVLAAAVGLEHDIEERLLVDVLAQLDRGVELAS